jgi:two-component system response regulator YesN
MRLGRSRQLLSATNDMISEVAYKVGYSDPIYFARRFKAKYGVSPSEYRKKERFAEENDNG